MRRAVTGTPLAIGSTQLISTRSLLFAVVTDVGGSGLKAASKVMVSEYAE